MKKLKFSHGITSPSGAFPVLFFLYFYLYLSNVKSSQFQFLHFGAQGLHETTTEGLFPAIALTSVPSLSQCFSFLLCRFRAALYRSSSSAFALEVPTQNLLSCGRKILPQLCSVLFHFRSLICTAASVSCARLRSPSLEITFDQQILTFFLRHLFIIFAGPW
jgi:hypothetical protein